MSHEAEKRRDARHVLSLGETRTVVILETDVDVQGTDLTKIENIKTFVRLGDTTLRFIYTVQIKIVDVRDSHAEAIGLKTID